MALDQLLSALEREAHVTADRLLAAAQAEVARLTAVADDEIARRREAAVAPRIREARAAMEATLGTAGRKQRGEVLRARERLLARVFATTRHALGRTTIRDDYLGSLPSRIAAALACIGTNEDVVIRCPPALVTAVQDIIREREQASVVADDAMTSGFVLATASGSLVIDDTLESRLERQAIPLARIALRALERPA